ncbi:MAG: flavin reductase [Frankiaceae bacterium]|nr:flavin reductase [Frankiaceae bacterium]
MNLDDYRRVAGHFATGVTVVTTSSEGRHWGMTANSFTSVSLEPVLVLVAIERRARFHDAVLARGTFGVNVLAADQQDLSRWFATRGRPQDDGEVDRWPHRIGPETGSVLFDGALATLECRTYATYPGGDHTLVVGEVVGMAAPRPDAEPLLFFKGVYRAMAAGPEDPSPSLADGSP